MSMTEQFKEELAVIKSAKLTFLVGFVVLAALIGYGEYSLLFKELLSQKDEIIKNKDSLINDLKLNQGSIEGAFDGGENS